MRFVYVFKFADEAAQKAHSKSNEVRQLEAVYAPELVSKGVEFIDYDWVAGKL